MSEKYEFKITKKDRIFKRKKKGKTFDSGTFDDYSIEYSKKIKKDLENKKNDELYELNEKKLEVGYHIKDGKKFNYKDFLKLKMESSDEEK